jgi:hypothetical protein
MSLNYKQVQDFVLKGIKGENNYNTIEQPHMIRKPVKNGEVDFNTPEVNNILENIPIHESLKKIYQVIGNPSVEYYFGSWTLFSLNKVKEHYDIFINKNQKRAIDFGIIYTGMGHCIMVTYDPELNMIYYRADGGSSGHDRDINFKFAYDFVPTEDKCIDLSDWFDNTINVTNIWEIKTVR